MAERGQDPHPAAGTAGTESDQGARSGAWRVSLHSLGCRLNEAESEAWAQAFQRRGFLIVPPATAADLVVVNSCAVTAEAVRKSRQLLRRCQRDNPGAKLIVSGCLATLEPEPLARQFGVDLIVANADKDRLVEIALDTLALPTMPEQAALAPTRSLFQRGRQRAFIKVQDGCRYHCTFCITTQARGAERSVPIDALVEQVRRLSDAGIQEVVLSGVHLGGYGSDLGTDLAGLVTAILQRTRISRLRLGSLEPWDLPSDFWRLFADPRLMPHLHLPLQSGSDRVLRQMARRCKTRDFARLVATGRARVPDLNVTTDIIVGFPGETLADWRQTLDFAAAMGFGDIHIFAYSPRPGTRAASLPDRVAAPEIKRRAQELQVLAARLRLTQLQRQLGKQVTVLREGGDLPEHAGYTPNYFSVRLLDPAPDRVNRILTVRLVPLDAAAGRLVGQLAETGAAPGGEVTALSS